MILIAYITPTVFRYEEEKQIFQKFPDWLPHAHKLHVWESEENCDARDLRHDAVHVAEGRSLRHRHALFLLRPRASERTGTDRVGGQADGAAHQRHGKGR